MRERNEKEGLQVLTIRYCNNSCGYNYVIFYTNNYIIFYTNKNIIQDQATFFL